MNSLRLVICHQFVTYKLRHHRTCPVPVCLQTWLARSSEFQKQAMTLWGHENLNNITYKLSDPIGVFVVCRLI